MSSPYISEIRMFGGSFAPASYAFCNGQQLSISQYSTVFALIGTTYGGDGQSTFNLPDLRSRLPLHFGQGSGLTPRTIGEIAGTEAVTVSTQQMPAHTHQLMASTNEGTIPTPGSTAVPGTPVLHQGTGKASLYLIPGSSTINTAALGASSIGPAGGNLPHSNLMPTLAVNFIFALEGVFPTRN